MDLTREHYRVIIFYDFKLLLNQDECVQRLQLAFGDESPARATVFSRFNPLTRKEIIFLMLRNHQKILRVFF